MILYHFTPARNIASILHHGLTVDRSRTAMRVVWLATIFAADWALTHVAEHCGLPEYYMAEIQVDIPRTWLRRRRRGVWYTEISIPPTLIISCHKLIRSTCGL